MINPDDIVDFERSDEELFEFALFCVCAAGKDSWQQAKKLHLFEQNSPHKNLLKHFAMLDLLFPIFGRDAIIDILKKQLQTVKMGKYSLISSAMWDLYVLQKEIGLRNASLKKLENIKGIGPKTARFFLMFTRPNQPYAILDTHILKFLRDCGIKAPKSTPSKKKYLDLEQKYRSIIMGMGVFPSPEQDLIIWKSYKYDAF